MLVVVVERVVVEGVVVEVEIDWLLLIVPIFISQCCKPVVHRSKIQVNHYPLCESKDAILGQSSIRAL